MAKSKLGVLIDRPIEEVWKFVSDFSNPLKVYPDLLELKQVSVGPVGVGTELVAKHRTRGLLYLRVARFDPGQKIAVEYTSKPIKGTTMTYSLEAIEGKTRLTGALDAKLSGMYNLMRPFIGRVARRRISSIFANVKDELESEAQP